MRKISVFTVLAMMSCAAGAASGQAPAKKRVAVLNFDYGTVQSYVTAIFNSNEDVGKGIADLLVDRLVASGVYTVIERKAIDKIMSEQNFSNSDRADSSTAAKLGRLLGAEVIIMGSVTQFGRDDKSMGIAGTALSGFGSKYGLGGASKKSGKAVVGITARLVNTDTGEILASETGRGESKRSGVNLLGGGGSDGSGGGGSAGMGASNFGQTIIGEAVSESVNQLAEKLQQDASRLPATVMTVDGLVADATGNTLVLNVGRRSGVKVGDRLEVRRVGKTITDPATGKVLRRIDSPIGTVTITDVDDQSAVGQYNGSGAARVGDRVKSPQ
jgi:curli biogenesis system outer membrane secretion channel CsgG